MWSKRFPSQIGGCSHQLGREVFLISSWMYCTSERGEKGQGFLRRVKTCAAESKKSLFTALKITCVFINTLVKVRISTIYALQYAEKCRIIDCRDKFRSILLKSFPGFNYSSYRLMEPKA